jgi:hypothetical protein
MTRLTTSQPAAVFALSQPRRRWPLWVGLLLMLAIVSLTAVYYCFVFVADRDVRQAMAEADASSPGGWQIQEILAQRAQIPDDENAALFALKVQELLPAVWPPTASDGISNPAGNKLVSVEIGELAPEVQLPADLAKSLRALLDQVEPARAEARRLIGMTRGRYPLELEDDNWVSIRGTANVSQAAQIAADLLRQEAELASQEDDPDRALASVRGMLAAARSVGDEPLINSALLRLDCDAMAVATLERTLAQGAPSGPELEAAQRLLESEAHEPILTQALRGERAGLHLLMLSLRDRKASLPKVLGEGPGFGSWLLSASGPTLARRSHARVLRLMNEFVAASELPVEQLQAEIDRIEKRVRQARNNDHDFIPVYVIPGVPMVSESYRRGVGNLRSALAAVAVERYRLDHGRWPDTLNALVPEYLAAVPTDPQDGKPLRYKRRREGIVVYWVGSDGIDDGGKFDRTAKYYTKGIDQGIQLWEAKHRRQRAP